MSPDEEITPAAFGATIVQMLWLTAVAVAAVVAVGIRIQYGS